MMSQSLGGHVDTSGECADIRVQLGIYVLGAISPADRALVVRHLATCPNCRDELVGLAALPGLLLRPPAMAAAYLAEVTISGASPPVPSHGDGTEDY
jgi:predicted anti-sigma-YlaC factor YlaD